MHDARAVGLCQPPPNLLGDIHRLVQRQRPPFDPLLERPPLVVRHHQVQLAVGCLVDLVDGANVGVVEGRCRLGFLEKPLLGHFVAGQVRREELDGDLALQPRVLGRVDDPHPTCAKLSQDRVRAEGGTWGQRHGRAGL